MAFARPIFGADPGWPRRDRDEPVAVNPWNKSQIKGDPRHRMTRVECVEGRHWLHVVQQAASQSRNEIVLGSGQGPPRQGMERVTLAF